MSLRVFSHYNNSQNYVNSNKDTNFRRRKGTPTNPIIVRAQEIEEVTLKRSASRYSFDNCAVVIDAYHSLNSFNCSLYDCFFS